MQETKENLKNTVPSDVLAIIDAQYIILNDPLFIGEIVDNIKKRRVNAEYSVKVIANQWKLKLGQVNDPYFSERKNDIIEVANILIEELSLLGGKKICLIEPVIIVSDFITLSELASLEKDKILGFITSHGGYTSHLAIVARALNIPAISMVKNVHDKLKNGDRIVLDAKRGLVIFSPTSRIEEFYKKEKVIFKKSLEKLIEYNNLSPFTKNNERIEFEANLEITEELPLLDKYKADGIGLFRTEFIIDYSSHLPSENEQIEYYEKILNYKKNFPVTMRTFDVGGDKMISEIESYTEENPFLGWRAIRFQLDNESLLRNQLRAFLIANKYGNLKILLPMISQVNEIIRVKSILKDLEEELKKEKYDVKPYKIGIMIEIPSAAIISDHFAKEVDFFSIGTNDLTQYTLAVDRGNEKVQNLFNSLDPSVLRLIRMVIENAKAHNIPVTVCGEMSSNPIEFLALLIIGIRKFSLVPWKIPIMKKISSQLDLTNVKKHYEALNELKSHEDIKNYIKKHFSYALEFLKDFTILNF